MSVGLRRRFCRGESVKLRFAFAAAAVGLSVMPARAAISAIEAARLTSAGRVVQDLHPSVPQEVWDRARCVVVIPDLKKAAIVFGGEFGRGVMSCRAGAGWSAPAFMELAKGSWGFQIGAEQIDLVLLVMNESGAQKMLATKVNLGADASVAAGPMGRQGAVSTDAAVMAEILSYSHAQGLFVGIDISGGLLRPDEDSNRDVYGNGASPRSILASREISAPPEAAPFLNALSAGPPMPAAAPNPPRATPPPSTTSNTGSAASGSAPSSTTVPSMTDSDVLARIVDIRQSIDRLLADAVAAPVGTTGPTTTAAASADLVTVSRDRLMQLRRQLDALLAAIEKR